MLRYIVYFFAFVCAPSAFGFVENISHGYPTCMACHVSPSGGGLLNDYGRSLSKELMSTWGWEGAEKPLFGAVENLEWLRWGGDYRMIQTYLDNSEIRQGRRFEMQKNIEIGIKILNGWLIGTLGNREGPEGITSRGTFLSERHFYLWDLGDVTKVRVGKFRHNFGLYDAVHTRPTKQSVGFGSNSESYILEVSQFSEDHEIFLSADLGRLDVPREFNSEKSFSVNYARYTTDKSKIGISALVGESQVSRRQLLGLYGVGGFFERWLLKAELDYQQSYAAASPSTQTDLIAGMTSLSYLLFRGFQSYAIFEYLQRDLSDDTTQQRAYGLGIQWLPVPHVNLQAEYKKENQNNGTASQNDIAWLLFHFYL